MKPTHILIHHSAGPDYYLFDWPSIRAFHRGKGWRTVGYHYGIEEVGGHYEIMVGRMMNAIGAHCSVGGMNRKSLGVCLVGNFNKHSPSSALLKVAIDFVSSLCNTLNIPRENVLGHGEADKRRTCPGEKFNMDEFRKRLVLSKPELEA